MNNTTEIRLYYCIYCIILYYLLYSILYCLTLPQDARYGLSSPYRGYLRRGVGHDDEVVALGASTPCVIAPSRPTGDGASTMLRRRSNCASGMECLHGALHSARNGPRAPWRSLGRSILSCASGQQGVGPSYPPNRNRVYTRYGPYLRYRCPVAM